MLDKWIHWNRISYEKIFVIEVKSLGGKKILARRRKWKIWSRFPKPATKKYFFYYSNLEIITSIWLFGSRDIKYGSKLVHKKIFSLCDFSYLLPSCEKLWPIFSWGAGATYGPYIDHIFPSNFYTRQPSIFHLNNWQGECVPFVKKLCLFYCM